MEKERSIETSLRTELLRQQAVSGQSRVIALASEYWLAPDDVITRGSTASQEPAVRVPSVPTLINLKFLVPNAHGEYRAVLRPLDRRTAVLAEDGLSPAIRDSEVIVTFSVPSNLLSSGRYYRVELRESTSPFTRTFTFYTTPAQQ